MFDLSLQTLDMELGGKSADFENGELTLTFFDLFARSLFTQQTNLWFNVEGINVHVIISL